MNHATPFLQTTAARAAVLAVTLLAAGCGSFNGPYAPPEVALPAQWPHGSAAAGAVVTAPPDARTLTGSWWTAFGDPALNRLVEQALTRNNDLAAAAIRVRRAQLQAGLADAALRPTVNGSLTTSAGRALDGGPTVRTSGANLGASYEVDLWNRLGSQRYIARWEAQATAQDREASAQALTGTTATLYWQLAYLGQRIDAGADSVAYAERTAALVQAQYHAGAVSSLEVAEAAQNAAAQRAAQTQLEQQRVEAANALALLFDGQTPAVPVPRLLSATALPPVAEGLPASLLARRPDLRAAELRLRSSFAGIDATRASYYPALSLTGALGTSSPRLGSVLQNPVATLGAGLTLPFLQFNQMRLAIGVSRTQYEEAVAAFRQTLYQALADTDNALSARRQYAGQAVQLEASLDAARTAERLYAVRYRVGAVALRIWLDAQERRRSAENALAENRYNRLANHALLLRVLGGGT
ncbi:MAG: efflux transporter outer membrane subunit [Pseudomonadota bacterium]